MRLVTMNHLIACAKVLLKKIFPDLLESYIATDEEVSAMLAEVFE